MNESDNKKDINTLSYLCSKLKKKSPKLVFLNDKKTGTKKLSSEHVFNFLSSGSNA